MMFEPTAARALTLFVNQHQHMKYTIFAFTEDGTPVEMTHLPTSEKKHLQKLFDQVTHNCPECNNEPDYVLDPPLSKPHPSAG